MANFIGLVYATLKNEGVDTKGMSADEAVAKYNELQKKSGGKGGENEGTPAEQKRLREIGVDNKATATKENLQNQYKEKFNEYQKVVDMASNLKVSIPAGLEDEIKRDEEFLKKYPNDEMAKYVSDKLNSSKKYLGELQKKQEQVAPKIEKLNKQAEDIKSELNKIRATARDKGFGELTGNYGDYD